MSTQTLELAPRENREVALRETPTPGQMMQAIIDKGITQDSVAAFEKLAELQWKFEERNGEKAFATAFVELQKDMPVIVAQSVIPNRGKYERFEDVMHVVGPLLTKHGFSVSFSNDVKDNRIVETCHLSHVGGHSRSTSFAVRIGGRADSDTQADCKAATTAKRKALQDALNIVIRQDCLNEEDDARLEGGTISEEKADELERRVKLTNSDVQKFLNVAGAKSFREILSGKYDVLDEMLRKKEQAGR